MSQIYYIDYRTVLDNVEVIFVWENESVMLSIDK